MHLSDSTIAALKNFATINQSLLFRKGTAQKTISVAKNVFGYIEIDDKLPKDFGIYDLNEFIAAISLFDEPEFNFGENFVTISDASGKTNATLVYNYADPSIIVSPPEKQIQMPSPDVSFSITQKQFDRIIKSASVLGLPDVVIRREGNKLMLGVTDKGNDDSNGYAEHVGDYDGDANFTFYIRAENMKVLPGDYTVEVSSKLITHWVGKENNAEYFIALEKSSTYEA